MKHIKISIIGAAWFVWSTTAYALMMKNLAWEIILIDINNKKLEWELRDLSDSVPFCETSIINKWTFEDAKYSDIIIITAWINQKPWESRIDLFKKNKNLILEIIWKLKWINNDSIILIITNPVDILTQIVQETLILPKEQIIWSWTLLDTQRVRWYLSEKLSLWEKSIEAYVLWEHWDSEFVAWSHANISNKNIIEFDGISEIDLKEIEQKTKNEAYEIIKAKGYTAFWIAACITDICENIIYNQKRVMPVSCFVENLQTVLWMPAIIWENWIEKILDLNLNKQEKEKLKKSSEKLLKIKNEY